ncbi:6404_t:CDS:2, partial [Funneliformis geosporum]
MSEKRKQIEEIIELDLGNNSNSTLSLSKENGSDVWKHFDKFKDDNNILRAKCKYCDKGTYNMSSSNSSTRNLKKHLKLHLDKTKDSAIKQANLMIKFLNDDKSKNLAIWIAVDDQPFTIIKCPEFQDLLNFCNSEICMLTADTIK